LRTRSILHSVGPAVLVGGLAFALTVQWRAQSAATMALEGRRAGLVRILESRQHRAVELEARIAALQTEIDRAADAAGLRGLAPLQDRVRRLAELAGTTEASGPGIVVTVADAAPQDATAVPSDSRIQDVDIQAVANALWLVGAEAIAVNGQRLVATSAIRNAGDAVLVNYRVLSSPYRVTAIGPAAMRKRFEASATAERFRGWAEIYGLGFEVQGHNRIDVPAYGGPVRARYAKQLD